MVMALAAAADDLGDGILGVSPGISREQSQVAAAHLYYYIAAACKMG